MNKNTFYISCPIDTFSGYGARSRDVVKALIELDKYDVRIIPQRWGSTPWGFIDEHEEEWGFLRKHIVAPQLTQHPDIWCQITVPNEFQPIGKYNIGITAGIETTVCAPQWIEGCNRMNIVLTSSNHSKRTFENSKFEVRNQQTNQPQGIIELNKPIQVLMEGANLEVYRPVKEFTAQDLYHEINSIPESFAYLFVGHWLPGHLGEDRKNVGLLIKAFYEVFKNKKKAPALILKTSIGGASYMDRREVQKRIDSIRKTVPDATILPNIYLLHGEFTDKEINELYNHPKVKAMVSLTKGEGFGRPLLEFSLSNKPIMTTGWSGHIDFLNKEYTALMGGELKNVHDSAVQKDMILKESQWFNVDHGEVGFYLKNIFENYKEWQTKGKRQGYHSRNNFSFDKMREQLSTILEENVPEIAKQVQLQLPKLKKIELPKLKKVE